MLFREALGGQLRQLRSARKLGLRPLAALARISPTYLGEIERGEKEVGSEKLADLARALDLPLAELLHQVAEVLADAPNAGVLAVDGEALRLLRRLPTVLGAEERRFLASYGDYLMSKQAQVGKPD